MADLLTKFDAFMDEATTRKFDSPLDDTVDIGPEQSPTVGSEEYIELTDQRIVYMSIVGGLLWLANMSRPDTAFASSQLSRVLTNPGRPHLRAAARVLIYLRGSQSRTLEFATNDNRVPGDVG